MKVRVVTIIRIWVLLFFVVEADIFDNLGIEIPALDYITMLSPIVLFILCRSTGFINRHITQYNKFFRNFFVCYFAFLLIETIYTVIMYSSVGLSIYYTVRLNLYLLYPLMIYPILYIMDVDGGMWKFLRAMLIIAVFGNLIRVISYVAYDTFGVTVFSAIVEIFKDNIRNGNYRLGAGLWHTLGFNIAICCLVKNWRSGKKWIYLIICIFFLWYQIVISQGRSQDVCYIVTIAFCVYFAYPKEKAGVSKVRFALGTLIIVCLVYLVLSNILGDFMTELFSTDTSVTENAGSAIARTYAITYYWSVVKNHLLCGLGLLYNDGGTLETILRGVSGIAYTEDLGLLGQFYNYGILGFVIFTALFVRWFLVLIKAYKSHGQKYFMLLLPLFVHGLTQTLTSMSLFQMNKFAYVPMYMAIFEFANYWITQEGREQEDDEIFYNYDMLQ